MINRSAYKINDVKIKDLKLKLLYLKGDDFIRDNGDKINENTRKLYDNMFYNCRKAYISDDELNNQVSLFKKIEDLMNNEWWKNEDFHIIIENENNEDNENRK
jgi:hypothetical protein